MTVARNYLSAVLISAVNVGVASLRVIVFGNVYGATAATDAFFNAYLLFRMFLEDVPSLLLPSLVPAYLKQLKSGPVDQTQRLLRHWGWTRGGQIALLVAALCGVSPWLLRWTTAGFSQQAAVLAGWLSLVTLMTSPILFLSCLLRVHLESRKQFVASGSFRALLMLVSTIGMALAPWLGIWAAMWGLVAGALGGLIWLWLAYRRDLRQLVTAESTHIEVATTCSGAADTARWSLLWILSSVLLQRAASVVDLHFGGMIEPGAITMFNQIGMLISLPVMILVQSLSTVLVPRAAELQTSGDWTGLRTVLWRVCLGVGGVSALAALLLAALAEPIVRLLFSHGAFDERQLGEMTLLLRFYTICIVPLSLHYACIGLTASIGAARTLVMIALVALIVRYVFLASRVERLSLNDLVVGHASYLGIWVLGLLLYLALRMRGESRAQVNRLAWVKEPSGAHT